MKSTESTTPTPPSDESTMQLHGLLELSKLFEPVFKAELEMMLSGQIPPLSTPSHRERLLKRHFESLGETPDDPPQK